MTNRPPFHTCPICDSQLHTLGPLEAWITQDGRVILRAMTPSPTQQRWLELLVNTQNWLAEIMRKAHDIRTI